MRIKVADMKNFPPITEIIIGAAARPYYIPPPSLPTKAEVAAKEKQRDKKRREKANRKKGRKRG